MSWLPGVVALGGLALGFAGGVGKPGALDLLPGCDGALVSGVVAMILLCLHGQSTRFAMLAVSPIVALAGWGFAQQHRLPLAPLGLQIALIGVVGLLAEALRARD